MFPFRLPAPASLRRLILPGALIILLAAGLRLYDLPGRAMHYDESLHAHYAWMLFQGEGYRHAPWMHGPFQIETLAAVFHILGDSDFTARLPYALAVAPPHRRSRSP